MPTKHFFKNTKESERVDGKRKEFPSNSRFITDSFKLHLPKINQVNLLRLYGGSLKIFIVLIFLLTTVIVGIDFKNNIAVKQNVDSQREKLTKELKFWESFLEKNKDFKDAYFQASILEYRLGNTPQAKIYLEKGLILDRNSEDGKRMKKFLTNK